MKAALWTGVLVVLPGAWFYAQGEALRWFTDGSLLACSARSSTGSARTPSGSRGHVAACSGAPTRSRCPPS